MNFLCIENDCFDIAKRIKNIDINYSIVFNGVKCTYELYYKDTYQLSIPYQSLDYRTIMLVLKTQNSNFEELTKSIDLENEIVTNNQIQTIKNNMNKEFEEQLFAK